MTPLNTQLEEYCRTISQLTDTLRTITDIEQKRLEIASRNQPEKLHPLLNDEQAALLSLRGQEQKRLHQAEALGFKDMTFQQVLEAVTEEQRRLLKPHFTKLQEQAALLRTIHEGAERIVGLRIRELEDAIAAVGGAPNGGTPHLFQGNV